MIRKGKMLSLPIINQFKLKLLKLISPLNPEEWSFLPLRVRASLLSWSLENREMLNESTLADYLNISCSALKIKFTSPTESLLSIKLADLVAGQMLMSGKSSYAIPLFTSVVDFMEYLLVSQNSPLRSAPPEDSFHLSVELCITKGPFIFASHPIRPSLLSRLFHLTEVAIAHPCTSVSSAGANLLIAFDQFQACSSHAADFKTHVRIKPLVRTLLAWLSKRRPETSTPLSLPNSRSSALSAGLLISTSACPNLPVVASVLGMITRGAPYNTTSTSRLSILSLDSSDWLRRLAVLLAPLPVDLASSTCFSANWFGQATSPAALVLWYTTWSIIDYKLKVAPWANPLKTLLSLEGAVRAFLQSPPAAPVPVLASLGKPNVAVSLAATSSSVVQNPVYPFHSASHQALRRQTWTGQLRQLLLMVPFLTCLEKMIYNAMEGYAVSLPRPLAPARAFFLANAATCSEWFGRLRLLMMRLSDQLPPTPSIDNGVAEEASATVLWNGYSLLYNLTSVRDGQAFLTQLSRYADPEELLILLAKALHRLTGWEELEALARLVLVSTSTVSHFYVSVCCLFIEMAYLGKLLILGIHYSVEIFY
ncbi:unnamed protein product [Protopolystoma xenopodis]|uniref:Uncharacterized protein n=1 Tax=Protopolystoma xenopodis TaxID=117903 RepID=A0A448WRS8_9PLAT|nr:unnamed protein product [Protopolystoma xenopodis]